MPINKLECPLNARPTRIGPITHTFYSNYKLTEEEIRLFEKLAPLPKPSRQIPINNIETPHSSIGEKVNTAIGVFAEAIASVFNNK